LNSRALRHWVPLPPPNCTSATGTFRRPPYYYKAFPTPIRYWLQANPILLAYPLVVGYTPLNYSGAGGERTQEGQQTVLNQALYLPRTIYSGKIGWAILSWAKIPSWYSKQRGLLHSREPHALLFYGRRPPKLRYIGQSGYALFSSL
jgi:hypothetical protein